MTRVALAPAVLAASLLAVACAPASRTTYRMDPASAALATWNGRGEAEVRKAWGEPSQRESDGSGGTILVYREKTVVTTSVEASSKPPSPDPAPSLDPKRTDRLTKDRARFWLDPKGTVYRYWFSSSVYKKGDNELPGPKPDESPNEPADDGP